MERISNALAAAGRQTLSILLVGGPVQEFLPFIFFTGGNPFLPSSPNQNKNGQMSNKERDGF